MALAGVFFDPVAAPGAKFPSQDVRDEIGEVAPTTIDPGAITEPMLATGSVTNGKLGAGAVTASKLGAGAVTAPAIAANAVTTPAIAAGAVTGDKTGTGVMRTKDVAGNYSNLTAVTLTDVEYDAIATPDPNTLYLIYWA